ncbi:MAG: hypothetical protein ACO3K7_03200 [Candidatus Marinamargulisbacteria bacterium]
MNISNNFLGKGNYYRTCIDVGSESNIKGKIYDKLKQKIKLPEKKVEYNNLQKELNDYMNWLKDENVGPGLNLRAPIPVSLPWPQCKNQSQGNYYVPPDVYSKLIFTESEGLLAYFNPKDKVSEWGRAQDDLKNEIKRYEQGGDNNTIQKINDIIEKIGNIPEQNISIINKLKSIFDSKKIDGMTDAKWGELNYDFNRAITDGGQHRKLTEVINHGLKTPPQKNDSTKISGSAPPNNKGDFNNKNETRLNNEKTIQSDKKKKVQRMIFSNSKKLKVEDTSNYAITDLSDNEKMIWGYMLDDASKKKPIDIKFQPGQSSANYKINDEKYLNGSNKMVWKQNHLNFTVNKSIFDIMINVLKMLMNNNGSLSDLLKKNNDKSKILELVCQAQGNKNFKSKILIIEQVIKDGTSYKVTSRQDNNSNELSEIEEWNEELSQDRISPQTTPRNNSNKNGIKGSGPVIQRSVKVLGVVDKIINNKSFIQRLKNHTSDIKAIATSGNVNDLKKYQDRKEYREMTVVAYKWQMAFNESNKPYTEYNEHIPSDLWVVSQYTNEEDYVNRDQYNDKGLSDTIESFKSLLEQLKGKAESELEVLMNNFYNRLKNVTGVSPSDKLKSHLRMIASRDIKKGVKYQRKTNGEKDYYLVNSMSTEHYEYRHEYGHKLEEAYPMSTLELSVLEQGVIDAENNCKKIENIKVKDDALRDAINSLCGANKLEYLGVVDFLDAYHIEVKIPKSGNVKSSGEEEFYIEIPKTLAGAECNKYHVYTKGSHRCVSDIQICLNDVQHNINDIILEMKSNPVQIEKPVGTGKTKWVEELMRLIIALGETVHISGVHDRSAGQRNMQSVGMGVAPKKDDQIAPMANIAIGLGDQVDNFERLKDKNQQYRKIIATMIDDINHNQGWFDADGIGHPQHDTIFDQKEKSEFNEAFSSNIPSSKENKFKEICNTKNISIKERLINRMIYLAGDNSDKQKCKNVIEAMVKYYLSFNITVGNSFDFPKIYDVIKTSQNREKISGNQNLKKDLSKKISELGENYEVLIKKITDELETNKRFHGQKDKLKDTIKEKLRCKDSNGKTIVENLTSFKQSLDNLELQQTQIQRDLMGPGGVLTNINSYKENVAKYNTIIQELKNNKEEIEFKIKEIKEEYQKFYLKTKTFKALYSGNSSYCEEVQRWENGVITYINQIDLSLYTDMVCSGIDEFKVLFQNQEILKQHLAYEQSQKTNFPTCLKQNILESLATCVMNTIVSVWGIKFSSDEYKALKELQQIMKILNNKGENEAIWIGNKRILEHQLVTLDDKLKTKLKEPRIIDEVHEGRWGIKPSTMDPFSLSSLMQYVEDNAGEMVCFTATGTRDVGKRVTLHPPRSEDFSLLPGVNNTLESIVKSDDNNAFLINKLMERITVGWKAQEEAGDTLGAGVVVHAYNITVTPDNISNVNKKMKLQIAEKGEFIQAHLTQKMNNIIRLYLLKRSEVESKSRFEGMFIGSKYYNVANNIVVKSQSPNPLTAEKFIQEEPDFQQLFINGGEYELYNQQIKCMITNVINLVDGMVVEPFKTVSQIIEQDDLKKIVNNAVDGIFQHLIKGVYPSVIHSKDNVSSKFNNTNPEYAVAASRIGPCIMCITDQLDTHTVQSRNFTYAKNNIQFINNNIDKWSNFASILNNNNTQELKDFAGVANQFLGRVLRTNYRLVNRKIVPIGYIEGRELSPGIVKVCNQTLPPLFVGIDNQAYMVNPDIIDVPDKIKSISGLTNNEKVNVTNVWEKAIDKHMDDRVKAQQSIIIVCEDSNHKTDVDELINRSQKKRNRMATNKKGVHILALDYESLQGLISRAANNSADYKKKQRSKNILINNEKIKKSAEALRDKIWSEISPGILGYFNGSFSGGRAWEDPKKNRLKAAFLYNMVRNKFTSEEIYKWMNRMYKWENIANQPKWARSDEEVKNKKEKFHGSVGANILKYYIDLLSIGSNKIEWLASDNVVKNLSPQAMSLAIFYIEKLNNSSSCSYRINDNLLKVISIISQKIVDLIDDEVNWEDNNRKISNLINFKYIDGFLRWEMSPGIKAEFMAKVLNLEGGEHVDWGQLMEALKTEDDVNGIITVLNKIKGLEKGDDNVNSILLYVKLDPKDKPGYIELAKKVNSQSLRLTWIKQKLLTEITPSHMTTITNEMVYDMVSNPFIATLFNQILRDTSNNHSYDWSTILSFFETLKNQSIKYDDISAFGYMAYKRYKNNSQGMDRALALLKLMNSKTFKNTEGIMAFLDWVTSEDGKNIHNSHYSILVEKMTSGSWGDSLEPYQKLYETIYSNNDITDAQRQWLIENQDAFKNMAASKDSFSACLSQWIDYKIEGEKFNNLISAIGAGLVTRKIHISDLNFSQPYSELRKLLFSIYIEKNQLSKVLLDSISNCITSMESTQNNPVDFNAQAVVMSLCEETDLNKIKLKPITDWLVAGVM